MKKILISFLIVFVLVPQISAQDDEEESKTASEKPNLRDRFFLAFTMTTYFDILKSPLKFHYTSTGNTDQQGNRTYASIPFQSVQMNIVSLGMEPRLNLKEFDDNSALTLAAPVSFGIGTAVPIEDVVVRGVSGFGSLQLPIILKLFFGNGSTYRTQKDFGFNFGGGLEMTKIGLINLGGENSAYNKPFVLPCLTAGVLFMRGDSPMEVNIKYGFGRLKSQDVNGQGDPLLDNTALPYRRNTRGETFKITLVYLMNY